MIKNIRLNHFLMENNLTQKDRDLAARFIKNNHKLTQGIKVKQFEDIWSKWLGVKYSVFVNSGSSANYLTFLCLKLLKYKGNVLVPALTWNSDIVSVINNNFNPIFLDIDLKNLSASEDNILKNLNKKNKILFLTHAQGFNGLTDKILNKIKKNNLILIEDVCESHGATFKNKKLGTYGLISNFSFYYAHHLSTIEGGMVCTNNRKIYEMIRILRGHGMAREVSNKILENKYIKKYKDLSAKFIFLYPGFNMRNNEISAVIGISQIKRLNKNIKIRRKNLEFFLKNLNKNIFYNNFDLKGNSNYAFPLILKKKSIYLRKKLEILMKKNNIEFRRGNAGGGNQLRQPYLLKYKKKLNLRKFPNVEHVHFFGYYIGNFPGLTFSKIISICKILNSVK
jgi:CDP-6-deoxy-D-xylo-4-hexulose-3-dehydrase